MTRKSEITEEYGIQKIGELTEEKRKIFAYRLLLRRLDVTSKRNFKGKDRYLYYMFYLLSLSAFFFRDKQDGSSHSSAFNRARDLIRSLTRTLDLTSDLTRTLDLTSDLAFDFGLTLTFTRSLALALARNLTLTRALILTRGLAIDLDHALNLVRDLALDRKVFDTEIEFLQRFNNNELYTKGLVEGLDLKVDDSYRIFKEYIFSPVESGEWQIFFEALLSVDEAVKKQESARELNRYLQAKIAGEMTKLNYARVLLLGNGGSGKTSLVKKIKNKAASIDNELPTPRIEISNLLIGKIGVSFWDFGGQVIMHSTHTFFLTEKSSYIIVCNKRRDEQPDSWLELLESQLTTNSRVLIVHTHAEDMEKRDDQTYFRANILKKRFPHFKLDFYALSNKSANAKSFKVFEKEFKAQIQKEADREVYQSLHNIYKKPDKNIVTLKKIKEINQNRKELAEFKNSELLANLLAFGYLFPLLKREKVEEYLDDDIFIWQRHWLTYGVYGLINSEITRKNKGRIQKEDFKTILFNGETRYIDQAGKLTKEQSEDDSLEELRYGDKGINCLYEICKNYKWAIENNKNRNELIFPHAVPLDEPEPQIMQPYDKIGSGRDDTYIVILFDSMPVNLFFEFIVLSEKHILEPDLFWRTGVILFDQFDKQTYASVILDKQKIEIKVTGKNNVFLTQFIMYYFLMLFRDYGNDKLKPQIIKQITTTDNEKLMINVDLMSKLDSGSLEGILTAIRKELKMGHTYHIHGNITGANLGDHGTVNINQVSEHLEDIISELSTKDDQQAKELIEQGRELIESKSDNKSWYGRVKRFMGAVTTYEKGITSGIVLAGLTAKILLMLP